MFNLGIGMALGHRILGPGFHRFQTELKVRADLAAQSRPSGEGKFPIALDGLTASLASAGGDPSYLKGAFDLLSLTKMFKDPSVHSASNIAETAGVDFLRPGEGIKVQVEQMPKRFRISKDPYSRARVKFLLDFRKAWNRSIDVPISISLYGSLSKGKLLTQESADKTDIDVVVFVDLDRLEDRFRDLMTDKKYQFFRKYYVDMTGMAAYDEIFAVATIEEYFFRCLERFSLNNKNSEGESKLESMGFNGVPEWRRWFQLNPIRNKGSFSLQEMAKTIIDFEAGADKEVTAQADLIERSSMAETVAELELQLTKAFLLDLGGGLRPYRQRFFKEMANMSDGSARQRVWSILRDSLIDLERNRKYEAHVPEELMQHFYPLTFDQSYRKQPGLKAKLR
jgi:hypothetical protein